MDKVKLTQTNVVSLPRNRAKEDDLELEDEALGIKKGDKKRRRKWKFN